MIDPVYDADGITLYFGECEVVMPMLTCIVDAVMADLPYATTKNDWDKPIDAKTLWHCYRALMGERSPVLLFGSGMFTAEMMLSNREAWKYNLVWDKKAITGQLNAKRQPLRAHEDILVFYDKLPNYDPQMVYTGRSSHSRGTKTQRSVNHYNHFENTPVVDQEGYQYPRSILEFARPKLPRGQGHPTQKPVTLMEWMVKSYTQPGDLILDNVCGSATTLVAARNCGRRVIGIEKHEPYVELAVARLLSGAEGDQWPSMN